MLRQNFIVNGHEAVYSSTGVENVLRRMFMRNSLKVHATFEYCTVRGYPAKRIRPVDIVVSDCYPRYVRIYGKGALAEMLFNIIKGIYESIDVDIEWFEEDCNGTCHRCMEY